MKWDTDSERLLLADACSKSLRAFCKHAQGIARNPEGWWWDESVHGPFCDWYQHQLETWSSLRRSKSRRRYYVLINLHRAFGKTVLVTKGASLWMHLRWPELSTVIDSVQQTQSIEFAEVIRLLYENKDPYAYFSWLYGRWTDNETWTKDRFTHAARTVVRTEASFECCSVETGITGRHPTVHNLDDPVTKEKLRDNGNWITLAKRHLASIFPALSNDSLLVLVATPYADNDVVTSAMREDGVCEVAGVPLPKEYSTFLRPDGKWHMYHLPGRDEHGEPTNPKTWSVADMEEYENKYPMEFAAQILLRPGSGGNQPLDYDMIEGMLLEPDQVPGRLPISIHIDTAFKVRSRVENGDDNVISWWGHLPGTGIVYFLGAAYSHRWNVDQFGEELVKNVQFLQRRHRIIALTDEQIVGGHKGVNEAWLRTLFHTAGMRMPRFISLARPSNVSKVSRHQEAAGYWAGGYVRLVRGAPGLQKLTWQMSRIGISDHDDFADVASDVFHPEVYRICRAASGGDAPPPPTRPFDRFLKDGSLRNVSPTDYYDAYENGEFDDAL